MKRTKEEKNNLIYTFSSCPPTAGSLTAGTHLKSGKTERKGKKIDNRKTGSTHEEYEGNEKGEGEWGPLSF